MVARSPVTTPSFAVIVPRYRLRGRTSDDEINARAGVAAGRAVSPTSRVEHLERPYD
ncbi:MAG: hypothetical protein R2706_03940 [Acidimicrobiales bacterium]